MFEVGETWASFFVMKCVMKIFKSGVIFL